MENLECILIGVITFGVLIFLSTGALTPVDEEKLNKNDWGDTDEQPRS